MTRHLLAGLFLSATLAAAESAHYDFYQKNGQNVLGAEIVSESATEYLVRLSYVPTPIKIQKANLARQPALSAVQPQITKKPSQLLQANFALHAFAGYAFFNAGQVASIFGQVTGPVSALTGCFSVNRFGAFAQSRRMSPSAAFKIRRATYKL
jgi:hypothetical protein